MSIKITCPNCNSVSNVKEEYIWKKWKCPKCWTIIEIKDNSKIENTTKETTPKETPIKKDSSKVENIKSNKEEKKKNHKVEYDLQFYFD